MHAEVAGVHNSTKMTTMKENDNLREKQAKQVNLSDLERILRKRFNDSGLQVIDCKSENFIPLGENFCSLMIKLDVTIRKGGADNKTELLNLVAKTVNPVDRPIIKWTDAFRRELFVYTELLPAYRDLEREAGVPEDELIDLLPRYYGHRNSLKEGSDDDFIDDDSLFLMENMKPRGYYTGDKRLGLDKDHVRLTLTALARYHALGVALKSKKPEVFRKVISVTNPETFGVDFDQLNEGFRGVLKNFQQTPCLGKHLDTIEATFSRSLDGKRYRTPGREPWLTVTHGDLWVNNLLFHKNNDDDDDARVDDVKFIDFQGYLYNSPLMDLARFAFVSMEPRIMVNHLDEQLDLYYDSFVAWLRRLGCDTKAYTKESFDSELKVQAIDEFPICAMATKFQTFEVKDEKDSAELMSNVFESRCSQATIRALQELVFVYEKRGFF